MHEDDLIPLKHTPSYARQVPCTSETKIVAFENKFVIYNLGGNSELFEGVLINMLVGPHHASYGIAITYHVNRFFIKLLRVTL